MQALQPITVARALELVKRCERERTRAVYLDREDRPWILTNQGLHNRRLGRLLPWGAMESGDVDRVLSYIRIFQDYPQPWADFVRDNDWENFMREIEERGQDASWIRRKLPKWREGAGLVDTLTEDMEP
jgi:hypothetical protein